MPRLRSSTFAPVPTLSISPPLAPQRPNRDQTLNRMVRSSIPANTSTSPRFGSGREKNTSIEVMVLDEDEMMGLGLREDDGETSYCYCISWECGDDITHSSATSFSPQEPLHEQQLAISSNATHIPQHFATAVTMDTTRNSWDTALPAIIPASSPPQLSAIDSATDNTPEDIIATENLFKARPRYPSPPPAPRLSHAVPILPSAPNVPPPYIRLLVMGPIFYTWETPQRQVHDYLDEHLEIQRQCREQAIYHHAQLLQVHQHLHQHVPQMTPRHARARVTLGSGYPYSSLLTGSSVGSSPVAGNGSALFYDTTGAIFSSPLPPKKGYKRVRFLVNDDGVSR
ncbi:hypothetical protein IWZ01DRAFT_524573 [Phyllosticta capitalensis]